MYKKSKVSLIATAFIFSGTCHAMKPLTIKVPKRPKQLQILCKKHFSEEDQFLCESTAQTKLERATYTLTLYNLTREKEFTISGPKHEKLKDKIKKCMEERLAHFLLSDEKEAYYFASIKNFS